jgi:hypothetical protein
MSISRYSVTSLSSLLESDPSSAERNLAERLRWQGIPVGESELRSWRNSHPVLTRDLVDADLGAVEVLLEYSVPGHATRSDVVLAGVHPQTGRPSYVVVELKQWSKAELIDEETWRVRVSGMRQEIQLHPSEQVAQYVDRMRGHLGVFESEPNMVRGVAYLHNASDSDVKSLLNSRRRPRAPLFTGGSRGKFMEYLRAHLAPGVSGARAADALDRSVVTTTTSLLAAIRPAVKERRQFKLLDEQKEAFDAVMAAAERAHDEDFKTLVLVTGGPGTGKSAVALELLGELSRRGRRVQYATGSASFGATVRAAVGRGAMSLFRKFSAFQDAGRNDLDVLILDEAQRIRKTSEYQYMPAHRRARLGRQIDEILDAARVPVFLLDRNQVIRPNEVGTPEMIREVAEERGFAVEAVELHGQFRCGGSEEYMLWVDALLGIGDVSNTPVVWRGDPRFDVSVVDSPFELDDRLRQQMISGASARITAGYCWPWSKKLNGDGTLINDVKIGDFERPWNAHKALKGAPHSDFWATQEGGFDQIGCIYTAHGLEYQWAGVIFGPDLVWRAAANDGAGGWVPQRKESKDRKVKGKKTSDAEFSQVIRNTYRVLLTRGLAGTVIYSTDPETREFLRKVVPGRVAGTSTT